MSNKFNNNVLSEYSKSYARRVAADFFSNHTVINGKEILNLTPITQINLFVISSLFEKWKADAEKFRSHYFDFTHPDVEEALRVFMNVVSQHICVRREHLEPLLADATKRTLVMLFDPRFHFDEVIRNQPDFSLTVEAAKQLTRYTQINKFVPATIEQRMNGKPFLYVNQALSLVDEILTQRSHELEKPDKYVALFSEKVPMDLTTLLRSNVPESFAVQSTRSFFDTELDTVDTPKPETPRADTPREEHHAAPPVEASVTKVEQPVNGVATEETPTGGPLFLNGDHQPHPVAPISQPSHMPATAISQPTAVEAPGVPETATINDNLRSSQEAPASLGEAFHRAPIESIAKSISLNQKFRFINQLFNGNANTYNEAISELDQVENYGQALDLISYRYALQYLWDMSSDEVSELVEILKRRFA
ncbi:hypothetical protein GCM10023189_25590 [Nibrella saemangeumensis]|uniref:Uncharacterized protein n=1 Tax=Nibrella saemangeumensis TaxID=1084526 RepID=A0ABP8MW50_9BACT